MEALKQNKSTPIFKVISIITAVFGSLFAYTYIFLSFIKFRSFFYDTGLMFDIRGICFVGILVCSAIMLVLGVISFITMRGLRGLYSIMLAVVLFAALLISESMWNSVHRVILNPATVISKHEDGYITIEDEDLGKVNIMTTQSEYQLIETGRRYGVISYYTSPAGNMLMEIIE